MFRPNSQIKYLIAVVLLFLKIETSYAIPLCAPQRFNFSIEDIIASLAMSPPGRDDDVFIINIKAKPSDDYTGRILIFDSECNAIYNQKLDYYPISIFSLDDGVSGIVFNLKQSGNGTYMLDTYYLERSKANKIMADIVSKDTRLSFIDYPNSSLAAPNIKVCFKGCDIYKFNNQYKRYAKLQSSKVH
jgi:hypothetical protein